MTTLNINSGDGLILDRRGHGFFKRVVLPIMLVAACTLLAGAMESESAANLESSFGQVHPLTTVQAEFKTAGQKERDFALSEVRKVLESNPETAVVDLAIDSDYKGAAGVYLVNVVLDAHGLKLSLGVLVSVQHPAESYQATMSFID